MPITSTNSDLLITSIRNSLAIAFRMIKILTEQFQAQTEEIQLVEELDLHFDPELQARLQELQKIATNSARIATSTLDNLVLVEQEFAQLRAALATVKHERDNLQETQELKEVMDYIGAKPDSPIEDFTVITELRKQLEECKARIKSIHEKNSRIMLRARDELLKLTNENARFKDLFTRQAQKMRALEAQVESFKRQLNEHGIHPTPHPLVLELYNAHRREQQQQLGQPEAPAVAAKPEPPVGPEAKKPRIFACPTSD